MIRDSLKPFVFIGLLPDIESGCPTVPISSASASKKCNLMTQSDQPRPLSLQTPSQVSTLGRRMTQTLGHGPSHANLWCFVQNSRVTDPSLLRLLWSEFVNIFLADSRGPWAEKLWHDRSEWIKNRVQHNNANDWSWCWSLILATGIRVMALTITSGVITSLICGPIKIMSPPPPKPFSSCFLYTPVQNLDPQVTSVVVQYCCCK